MGLCTSSGCRSVSCDLRHLVRTWRSCLRCCRFEWRTAMMMERRSGEGRTDKCRNGKRTFLVLERTLWRKFIASIIRFRSVIRDTIQSIAHWHMEPAQTNTHTQNTAARKRTSGGYIISTATATSTETHSVMRNLDLPKLCVR